ncbi:MAG TPA: nucleotidyltransferase family protein [Acidimicrobiia bacterium]|jgi:hypothetical protein
MPPWSGLVKIIDRTDDWRGLELHGLLGIAAARAAATGRATPAAAELARAAAGGNLLRSQAVLEDLRRGTNREFLVFKGPEVAVRWPDASWREYADVDVLADDAEAMRADLAAAGWRDLVGPTALRSTTYERIHHVRPLIHPTLSMTVEIHRRANWPTWGTPPPFEDLADDAVPSATGVTSVMAPTAPKHALLVLAHSCARQPIEQLSQLVDLLVLSEMADVHDLHSIAHRWGLFRLLGFAHEAIDSLILGNRRDSLALRMLAPHLRKVSWPSARQQQLRRYASSPVFTSPAVAGRALMAGAGRRARTVFVDRREDD